MSITLQLQSFSVPFTISGVKPFKATNLFLNTVLLNEIQ